MKYTKLGNAGAKVSKLCLGTMNFGSATDEKESFAIMDAALDCGINFFDTADFYGSPAGQGITETIIGRWLSQGGRRERIVLATKCYATMNQKEVNDRGLSAYHIRRACDDSLKRLQTDHIDLYIMHHYDRGFRYLPELLNVGEQEEADLDFHVQGGLAPSFLEILESMERLKQKDKITYTGSANFPAWAIAHFNGLAAKQHQIGIIAEQSIYNLRNRAIEAEVIPACRELGVGLNIYSPLGGGLLSCKKPREQLPEQTVKELTQFQNCCKELGESPADVAVAWVLQNRSVNTVILGPKTRLQLEQSLHALQLDLPTDFVNKIKQIWSHNESEAPECYAW